MNSVPSNFWEWLSTSRMSSSQQSELFLTSLFVVAGSIVLIAAIIAFTIYRIHRNRLNDALKREMLDRGLPAEDIVEIIRAAPGRRCNQSDV